MISIKKPLIFLFLSMLLYGDTRLVCLYVESQRMERRQRVYGVCLKRKKNGGKEM